jgi:hypothetical protein
MRPAACLAQYRGNENNWGMEGNGGRTREWILRDVGVRGLEAWQGVRSTIPRGGIYNHLNAPDPEAERAPTDLRLSRPFRFSISDDNSPNQGSNMRDKNCLLFRAVAGSELPVL